MVQKYFNQLNYSLGNEDTAIDVEIVRRLGSKNVFSVAGCGGRALPLLEYCHNLTMVDFSSYQLALSRLRLELYRKVDWVDYCLFFEYPPFQGQDNRYRRRDIFASLELQEADRSFFRAVFEELNWGSLLYAGSWERTFQKLSKALRVILGKNYDALFEFQKLDEQVHFFKNEFNKVRWNSLLFLLGNKSVFNALLYKGDFISKNEPESHFEYYKQSFEKLFTHSLARESFFAHLCFYGKIIHSDGNPIEAKKNNFSAVKEKACGTSEILFSQGDLVEILASDEHANKYDFLSLSDVPSYFSGDTERQFLQKIKPSLNEKGVICLRNYLRTPEADYSGFEDITDQFKDLYGLEKVGVYRFQIFQKK